MSVFGSGIRPWKRQTETKRAADSSVPGKGELVVSDTGKVYAGDGATQAKNLSPMLRKTDADATYVPFLNLARNPDLIISGAVTRNANGVVTSAPVVWPDGTPGTYTTDTIDATGAVNGYHITYGSPATKTYTQPTITRDSSGAATNVPAMVVS